MRNPNASSHQFLKSDRKLYPERYYDTVTINPLTHRPMPKVGRIKHKTFRHACTVMKNHGLEVPDSSVLKLNQMTKLDIYREVDKVLEKFLTA